jgi:hypothetical protein
MELKSIDLGLTVLIGATNFAATLESNPENPLELVWIITYEIKDCGGRSSHDWVKEGF